MTWSPDIALSTAPASRPWTTRAVWPSEAARAQARIKVGLFKTGDDLPVRMKGGRFRKAQQLLRGKGGWHADHQQAFLRHGGDKAKKSLPEQTFPDGFCAISCEATSCSETRAHPTRSTAHEAATFDRAMESSMESPEAYAALSMANTVSPAPVTSRTSFQTEPENEDGGRRGKRAKSPLQTESPSATRCLYREAAPQPPLRQSPTPAAAQRGESRQH